MRFIDLNDSHTYTLSALKKEWEELRAADPENHAQDFKTEFFEILMATVNGRNDLDVIGPTPQETSRFILWLRAQLPN